MANIISTAKLFEQPEYDLLKQAMKFANNGNNGINKAPIDKIDWSYLFDISEQHALMPLLYLYLKSYRHPPPDTIMDQLHDMYHANALRNRILTNELVKLLELFSKNNIPSLTYKGPSLALQAYGELAHRQFGDLDILIHPGHVDKASQLMKQIGYQREIPELSPKQEQDFIHTAHEHTFISPDQLVHVDLHWSPSNRRFPFRISTHALLQRSQSLQWQDNKILHLASQDLLLILCMHANKDLWRKLVWICDIDRLIRKSETLDWASLVQQARESHCEKMLYMALCIAHDVLGTPIPDDILLAINTKISSHQGNKILQLCMQENKPVRSYLQCMAIQPHVLSVCDSLRDRFYYISRSLLTPTECDMMKINIPPSMHLLYYLITPLRKITFCTARYFKRLVFNQK